MRRIRLILAALMMAFGALLGGRAFATGGLSVSRSSITLTTGSAATFAVTATNAAGKVDIVSSNTGVATVSTASEWVENGSVTVTVAAVGAGSATITVRAADMTTYDYEDLTGTTRTIAVAVNNPAPAPEPAPAEPESASNPAPATDPTPSNEGANNGGGEAVTEVAETTAERSGGTSGTAQDVSGVILDTTEDKNVEEGPAFQIDELVLLRVICIAELLIIVAFGLTFGIYLRGHKRLGTCRNLPPTETSKPQTDGRVQIELPPQGGQQ